ncbi:MAG: ankyrin repeat domain-containing protein [Cyanothece sp. SIO1E1]|nr:ankyrin repeat domain-containing protein [Cyanothece sp. SIO1E1]
MPYREFHQSQLTVISLVGLAMVAGCNHPATITATTPASNEITPVSAENAGAALINATQAGDLQTVEMLLANGVDPNAVVNTNTALTFAARDGQLAIARTLINQGADVNWIDGENVTPLILASFKGHVELVKLLLAHGANPTIRDQWHRTALDYALRRGEDDEIAQLLQ